MTSLFETLIHVGTGAVLTTDFNPAIVEGRFMGRDEQFIYLCGDSDVVHVVPMEHVLLYSFHPVSEGAAKTEETSIKGEESEKQKVAKDTAPTVTAYQQEHGLSADAVHEPVGEEPEDKSKEENAPASVGDFLKTNEYRAEAVTEVTGPRILGRIDPALLPQKKDIFAAAARAQEMPEGLAEMLDFIPRGTASLKSIGPKFGYLRGDEGPDIFFGTNNTIDRLQIGQRVMYTREEGDRGPMAFTIYPIDTMRNMIRRYHRLVNGRGGLRHAANVKEQLYDAIADHDEWKEALQYALSHPESVAGGPAEYEPYRKTFVNYSARERAFADNLLPQKYKEYMKHVIGMIDKLEADNDESTKKFLHHLYTRVIKNAREDDVAALRQRAVESFTKRGEEKNALFFARHGGPQRTESALNIRKRLGELLGDGVIDHFTYDTLKRFTEYEGLDPQKIANDEVTTDELKTLSETLQKGTGKITENMWLTLIKLSIGQIEGYDPSNDVYSYYKKRIERALRDKESQEMRSYLFSRLLQYVPEELWASEGTKYACLAVMNLAGLDADEVLGALKQTPSTESIFRRLNPEIQPDLYLKLARLAGLSDRLGRFLNYNLEAVGLAPIADLELPTYDDFIFWVTPDNDLTEVCGRFENYLNEVISADEALLNMEKSISAKLLEQGINEIRKVDQTARDEDDRDTGYNAVVDFLKTMGEVLSQRPTEIGYGVLRPVVLGLQTSIRHDHNRRDRAREQYRVR